MREGQARDAQGLPVTNSQRSLQDWLQDWLNDVKAHAVRPRTLDLYRSRLQHVVDAIGPKKLADIRPQDIRRVYADMRQDNLSNSTIAAIHRTLSGAMNDAVKDGLLLASPCASVKPPQPNQKKYRTLTVEQVSQLVGAEKDPMWRALWALLGTTGMRSGEACGLCWDAVDLNAGELHVDYTLVRLPHGGGWMLGEPKTRSSKRIIYLGQTTIRLLSEWRTIQAQQPLRLRERFVFTSETQQPLYQQTVGERLKAVLKQARLPRITPHELRHSAATNMLARGELLKVVSEMLGHSNVAITLNLYQHVIPAQHREAIARIDALL